MLKKFSSISKVCLMLTIIFLIFNHFHDSYENKWIEGEWKTKIGISSKTIKIEVIDGSRINFESEGSIVLLYKLNQNSKYTLIYRDEDFKVYKIIKINDQNFRLATNNNNYIQYHGVTFTKKK